MRQKLHILKYYMYTMFILLGMASCHWFEKTEEDDKHIYDRTVLVYAAADNNLASYLQGDIDEMVEGAGNIPKNSRLLVYVDDYSLPRILSIEQEKGRRPVAKTLYEYESEHNSGDAETLRLAMQWMMENSPSESYGLVIWSHGKSWVPAKAPAQRAICVDGDKWMEIGEIADVLSQFTHLEFILFDACFMQAIEVAYELREATNYIVSSPAEIPGPGAPYHRIMAPMFDLHFDAGRIAEEYYLEYEENDIFVQGHEPDCFGVCLSVVDCSLLDRLATLTKEMLEKYIHYENSVPPSSVQQYYPYNNKSTIPEYYDMNAYMRHLITDDEDYDRWKAAFDEAVPYQYTTEQWFSDYSEGLLDVDTENYGGVSCYVPKVGRTKLNTAFRNTQWYNAAGWNRLGW